MSIKKSLSILIILCVCTIAYGEDIKSKFTITPSVGGSIGITDRENVITGLLSTNIEYEVIDNMHVGLGGTVSVYEMDESLDYNFYPGISLSYDITETFTLGFDFGSLTSLNYSFYNHQIKTGLLVTNDLKLKGFFMGYGYRFSL